MKYVSPSIKEKAFNCPHCSVLTSHYWYLAGAKATFHNKPPTVLEKDFDIYENTKHIKEKDKREKEIKYLKKLLNFIPFIDGDDSISGYIFYVGNVSFSKCYNCDKISVWVYDRIVYPNIYYAPIPNPDFPEEILRDYNEASSILDLSPRGAAALVRVCIQKLCKHLGQPGKNINDDIKALVTQGLDPRIQRALDAVRVIGNNAVHPGELDISDDRATAESLFRLLNLIAEKMISEPKHVDEVYALLPEGAKAQIEARDRKG